MKNEEKIIGMFEQIMGKLDEHTQILNEHSQILEEHSIILKEHSQILREHSQILSEHSETLGEHSQTLGEHSQILSALRTGQEHLKAEMDGMKISSAKEFGAMKSGMDNFKIDIKILKDQSWENKADIERIKNTMGMS